MPPVLLYIILGSSLVGELPAWLIYLQTWCYFVYRVLDNLSQVHAKQSENQSPLFQMFDHGIDCLSLGILSLFYLRVMQTGYNFVSTAFIVAEFANFYLATLSEYYTGRLILPYFNGVSDGSLAIVSLSFIVGIVGNDFFTQSIVDLSILNWTGITDLTMGQLLTMILTVYNCVHALF